jgi:D-3-phosphoglycerate dehydrogenase
VAWYSEESSAELRSKAAMGVIDVLLHREYPKYLVNKQVKGIATLAESQSESRYAALV